MVHYQIPASVDIYVHRSGRTARGEADGLAIALVAPKEAPRYAALQQVSLGPLWLRACAVCCVTGIQAHQLTLTAYSWHSSRD